MDDMKIIEQELMKWLQENPADIDILGRMVNFYGQKGDLAKAAYYLQRMADLSDDAEFVAAMYLELGRIMEICEEYARASGYYNKGLAMNPERRETAYFLRNNLGYCLNLLGRPEEALTYCEEAIRISGDRHNAFKNSAISLQAMGNLIDAGKRYIKATTLCPVDRRAFYHLRDMVGRHPDLMKQIPNISEFMDCYGERQEGDGIENDPLQRNGPLQ